MEQQVEPKLMVSSMKMVTLTLLALMSMLSALVSALMTMLMAPLRSHCKAPRA